CDERLPEAERTFFTPTPRQMLYGPRVVMVRTVIDGRDAAGRAVAGHLEVEWQGSRWAKGPAGFVFSSFPKPVVDGALYTLDPCPNDWYGFFCASVIKGLCTRVEDGRAGENVLYQRLTTAGTTVRTNWPAEAAAGQARFLEGLEAMHAAGALHPFEPSKR